MPRSSLAPRRRSALSARDSPPRMNEDSMKKQTNKKGRSADRMRPEYDFSKGVSGKRALGYASGTNVVLAPDVASPVSDCRRRK
jgi:hypothetical protein